MRMRIILTLVICVILAASVYVYLQQPSTEVVLPVQRSQSSQSDKVTPKPQTDASTPAVTPKEEQVNQDWLNEEEDVRPKATDLWKEFRSPEMGEAPDLKNDMKWFTFDNPEDYEKMRQQLVDKFGDTPEVQAYMDSWLKDVSGPTTLEDDIAYAEATYALFPYPETQQTIALLKAHLSGDMDAVLHHLERVPSSANSTEPFADVLPFFQNNNHEEAFRRLRESNPKRAIEFEEFILEWASRDPYINRDDIERAIERSYQTPQENK